MFIIIRAKYLTVNNTGCVVRLETLRVEIEIGFSHYKLPCSLISCPQFNIIKVHGLFIKLRSSFNNFEELFLLFRI